MAIEEFRPRTAPREDRRQANEALGRSFCKTLSEPITNSDSSAKRKLSIPHASGLIELMFSVAKGDLLDTSSLKARLRGKYAERNIDVEVVTDKSHGRDVGELRIVDRAQGMNTVTLKGALDEIGGDKLALSGGTPGRNLFGRGLSDFLRAHNDARIWTYDGNELTIAMGEWRQTDGWWIKYEQIPTPKPTRFRDIPLDPTTTGTVVACIIRDRQRCHIPDHPNILERLRNFYMLRLIAADPNVKLLLRQFRAKQKVLEDRIQYDFPVGEVIEVMTRQLELPKNKTAKQPIRVDFLLARSDKKLRGLDADRDARENGLLIVDDLDAVYDLTFADSDYERADFLRHVFGVVRVHGLRNILEGYLNSPDIPTSPLRIDRDGFNTDHEFSQALLGLIGDVLRPYYERERERAQAKDKDRLSTETKKRIDEALKHLNKYFNEITGRTGTGRGSDPDEVPPEPMAPVEFMPSTVKLTAGRPKHVLLLVREDIAKDHGEVCASGTEGITVQPDTDNIDKETCPRKSHPEWRSRYLSFRFAVSSEVVGQKGSVTALVDATGEPSILEAKLEIQDVLTEPEIVVPETMEFRPLLSLGRPGRRNNLVLYVNTAIIALGQVIRIRIVNPVGDVMLLDSIGERFNEVDVEFSQPHLVHGQGVARILVPWNGTAWNQHATIEAKAEIAGNLITAAAEIRLDEPDPKEGGFFKKVEYVELDEKAPSQYAAGTISVNTQDPLNHLVFGENQTEFDRHLLNEPLAQQRLASLLLEEAAFRALEEQRLDNKLLLPQNREVDTVHQEVNSYKFNSAVDVFKAIVK